ncbi:MAG TPA: hypothetical protein VIS06_04555 [Mycobacteriales bacterium]|jgi:hypothetical protein
MARSTDQPGATSPPATDDRLGQLEEQVQVLAEAVRVLSRGLESRPTEQPDSQRPGRAAAQAHELLLAARL